MQKLTHDIIRRKIEKTNVKYSYIVIIYKVNESVTTSLTELY